MALQCNLQKYHTPKVICGDSSLGLSVLIQQLFKLKLCPNITSINRQPLFAHHAFIKSRDLDLQIVGQLMYFLNMCSLFHLISFICELLSKEGRVSLEQYSASKIFAQNLKLMHLQKIFSSKSCKATFPIYKLSCGLKTVREYRNYKTVKYPVIAFCKKISNSM